MLIRKGNVGFLGPMPSVIYAVELRAEILKRVHSPRHRGRGANKLHAVTFLSFRKSARHASTRSRSILSEPNESSTMGVSGGDCRRDCAKESTLSRCSCVGLMGGRAVIAGQF